MCCQCKAECSHSRWLGALASNLFVNSERFRNVITGCQWNPVSCCDHMVWKLLLLYRLISAALLAICLSDIIKASLQLQSSPRSCNTEMSENVTWGQMELCEEEASGPAWSKEWVFGNFVCFLTLQDLSVPLDLRHNIWWLVWWWVGGRGPCYTHGAMRCKVQCKCFC